MQIDKVVGHDMVVTLTVIAIVKMMTIIAVKTMIRMTIVGVIMESTMMMRMAIMLMMIRMTLMMAAIATMMMLTTMTMGMLILIIIFVIMDNTRCKRSSRRMKIMMRKALATTMSMTIVVSMMSVKLTMTTMSS